MSTPSTLVDVSARLRHRLSGLSFSDPVTHVYNPLEYAWEPHRDYLRRCGQGTKDVVLVGMNPGPWGMAQNGVPFGATTPVRDFLGVRGNVGRPDPEHPKRIIEGLELQREEVSGTRLWGWVEETWKTPEAFFERFFVYNFCPLCFLAVSGRNVTPDKLRAHERKPLLAICAEALREGIRALEARRVIGVGAWAEKQCAQALEGVAIRDWPVEVGRVLHPSPASPKANRGWADAATEELRAQGIQIP
ncbi:MAG: single-stranded DNA-binding protein [Thermoanaerobaculia bacterium]|nr:single-stranded DNA-binding protein [Thermoanaerobaculia bacterium]